MFEQGDRRTVLTDAVQAAEVLRLAAAETVRALEFELARDGAEQALAGAFFEALRARKDLTRAGVVRRALRLGCDVSHGGVALCAELAQERPHLVGAIIHDEHPGALAQEIPPSAPDGRPRIYAVLPAAGAGERRCVDVAIRLSMRLERYGPVGISSFHADPAELPSAIRESELMLDFVRGPGSLGRADVWSGTYRLLVRLLASHPEELTDFYESTVAAMVRYDEQNGTDLVRTLDAYLNANCNMNVTAATIFAHRHTIASRLERIRELTGLDPMRFEDRERLGLGLKAQRLLASRRRPRSELPLRSLDRQQRLA